MDRSILVGKRTYTFKDDYLMYEQEKVEDAISRQKKGEISDTEVSYVSIFWLLESITEDGQDIKLDYNQIREDFRNMKSKDFKKMAEMFAAILGTPEDKKKE